jgi:hypothetical protein
MTNQPIKPHCPVVAEVMTEIAVDYFPGIVWLEVTP